MEHLDLKELYTNQKIQILSDNKLYDGIIIGIYKECIAINVSMVEGNFIALKSKSKLEILIAYMSLAYRCTSNVLGCKVSDSMEIILLDTPNIINKIERRRHVRINNVIDAEYCFLPDNIEYNFINEVSSTYFAKAKKTFTINLSSNGVKIITYEDSKKFKNAVISLNLNSKKVNFLASVVRTEYDEFNKNFKTSFSIKDMDKYEWQILSEFINEKINVNSNDN